MLDFTFRPAGMQPDVQPWCWRRISTLAHPEKMLFSCALPGQPLIFAIWFAVCKIEIAGTATSQWWDSSPSPDPHPPPPPPAAVKAPPPPPPPTPPLALAPSVCRKMFRTELQWKRYSLEQEKIKFRCLQFEFRTDGDIVLFGIHLLENDLNLTSHSQVGRVHIGHLVQLGVADFTEKWVSSYN